MNSAKKGEGSLLSQYTSFAAATVASLLVYSLYSMVDGLFVSHGVNEYAMSAVNLALPYTNILFSVSILFGVGSSVIVAIYLAKSDSESASRLFSQNTALLIIIGAVLTALLFIFIEPFVSLLGADATTHDYTRDYLRGLAPFSACFIVSYSMEILIKTDGRPKKALYTVLAGCLCNCILDYIAIFVLGMGVFGAAVATGMSQLFVCIIYFHHFLKCKTTFHFVRTKPDFSVYRRLLPLGVADAITEICNGAMIFLFNRTIQRHIGADGIVSYTVIAYINTVVINIVTGASAGGQPLVSFHHGKNEERECQTLFRYSIIAALIIETCVMAVIFIFGMPIVKAFIGEDNTALCVSSLRALKIYSVSFALVGLNIVIGGYLTARERPVGALAISLGRGFVFQAISLTVLAYFGGGGAIWLAPVFSEAVCLMMSIILCKRMSRRLPD